MEMPAPWRGLGVVDVVAGPGVLLVVFTWGETPGVTYVRPLDVRDVRDASAATVDILAMRVLEDLGPGWWRKAALARAGTVALCLGGGGAPCSEPGRPTGADG
jgi:hypothetical protein